MEDYDFGQYIHDVWEANFDGEDCALECLQNNSAGLGCTGPEPDLGACLCDSHKFLNDASCCTYSNCPKSEPISSAKDVYFILSDWCTEDVYDGFHALRNLDCAAAARDLSSNSDLQSERRDGNSGHNSSAGIIVGIVIAFVALGVIFSIVGIKTKKQRKRAARAVAKNSQRYRTSLAPLPLHNTVTRPPPVRAREPRPSTPPPPPPYSASPEGIHRQELEPPRYEA